MSLLVGKMEFVILGSNVKEGCFSIKVDYMKLIGLAMKQYELGCFIHRDERELEAAATSSSLSTNMNMKTTTTYKILQVH